MTNETFMNFFLELKLAPYTLYNHIRVEMSEVTQTASIDQALAWFFRIMWRGPKDISSLPTDL